VLFGSPKVLLPPSVTEKCVPVLKSTVIVDPSVRATTSEAACVEILIPAFEIVVRANVLS
jgi:hypothetical protein